MLIHIVNPNTSRSFTDKVDHAARAVASPGTEISATQPAMGPVSIEGYYDEAYAIPGMLARIREAEALGADAHVIACFDDTGLDAARQLARAPVIGIGEAAYHVASLVAGKFAVVTTLALAIPQMEHNLVRYGLATRCAKVRAAGIPVLALEDPASGGVERISAEIEAAKRDDHAEAIVLGCAGMADLAADLSAKHGLPASEADHATFRATYSRHLHERLTARNTAEALPGALALVESVRSVPGVTIGLLTGNYMETGRTKVRFAGFDPDVFVVNAWGDEGPDRRSLVPVAHGRYRERHGMPIARERVVIIGDTPADVDCAKAHGARVLAVATGGFKADALRATPADRVVDDLRDTAALTDWITKA